MSVRGVFLTTTAMNSSSYRTTMQQCSNNVIHAHYVVINRTVHYTFDRTEGCKYDVAAQSTRGESREGVAYSGRDRGRRPGRSAPGTPAPTRGHRQRHH